MHACISNKPRAPQHFPMSLTSYLTLKSFHHRQHIYQVWSKHTQLLLPSCSQGYFNICPLWFWPLTLKINRVHPLIVCNVHSTVWSVQTVHKSIFIYSQIILELLFIAQVFPLIVTLTLKINRLYPLTIDLINVCSKGQNILSCLIPIMFISLFLKLIIVTFTFDPDLQNQ